MISNKLLKVLEGKESIFFLDLSWFMHRSYHSFNWMSVDINGYKRPTGHIYGVLYTIQSLKEKYPNSSIVLCQDGIPVERQELLMKTGVGYKDGREELQYDFYKDIPLIESACYLCSDVYWAYNKDKESDDIMYALAKQSENVCNANLYIYSGDNDLLQAIDNKIRVVRKVGRDGSLIEIDSRKVVSDMEFTKKFHGVDPEHLPYFRSIVGDSSDNIKGISRFPRKLAYEIAMRSNSFDEMFRFEGVTETEKRYCNLLQENRALIEINYKMMKLRDDFNVNVTRMKPNVSVTILALESLKMNKYLKFLGVN